MSLFSTSPHMLSRSTQWSNNEYEINRQKQETDDVVVRIMYAKYIHRALT